MKILLTGSSGFIGQNLCPLLEKIGTVYNLKSDLNDHASVAEEVKQISPNLVVLWLLEQKCKKVFTNK